MLSSKAGIIMGYGLLTAVLHTSCLRLVLCGYTRQDCVHSIFYKMLDKATGSTMTRRQFLNQMMECLPESRLAIPEPDLQRLKHQLDPLSNSDNYGTELYEQVVDFVVHVLQ